jgi:hypothetical protein
LPHNSPLLCSHWFLPRCFNKLCEFIDFLKLFIFIIDQDHWTILIFLLYVFLPCDYYHKLWKPWKIHQHFWIGLGPFLFEFPVISEELTD